MRQWVIGAQPRLSSPPHTAYSKKTTFISRSYIKVGAGCRGGFFLWDKTGKVNPVYLPPGSNSSAPAYAAALI